MFNVNLRVNDEYKKHKRAFLVDNFYHNPLAVREFAMKQTFIEGGLGKPYIGSRTEQQFLFPGIKEVFEEILNLKITKWEEHGMNGRFQFNVAGEPIVYHCDNQRFAGMIYLNPTAPIQCGTSTFRHKETKIHHLSHPDIISKVFNTGTFLDGTPYEKADQFGNIFNRLVIFDAGCIHAANEYFGTNIENGRLWHMFFFDAE